jgi:hypothetical protein
LAGSAEIDGVARILLLTHRRSLLQEQPMPSSVRFTQAQKRDLLRISGAALVSTIFFAVPMFIGRPDATAIRVQPAPQSRDTLTAAVQPDDAPAGTAVSVVVSETVAQVTVPELQTPASSTARPVRAARFTRRAGAPPPANQRAQVAPAPATATPLARRLGRLIAGTGRYEVRPFPTIGSPGS